MYSNLDHADKKTLNNEDYIKKIMESEARGSQVSSSFQEPPPHGRYDIIIFDRMLITIYKKVKSPKAVVGKLKRGTE